MSRQWWDDEDALAALFEDPWAWMNDHAEIDHPALTVAQLRTLYDYGLEEMSDAALDALAGADLDEHAEALLPLSHPVVEAREERKRREANRAAEHKAQVEREAGEAEAAEAAEAAARFEFVAVPDNTHMVKVWKRVGRTAPERWADEDLAVLATAYAVRSDDERAAFTENHGLRVAWEEMRRRLTRTHGADTAESLLTAHTEAARAVEVRRTDTAHAALVLEQVDKLRARRDAQEILRREQEGEAPPFDDGLLEEVLARPPEPPYRIEGLIPSDAGTVIVAQRKAGKTTLMLNLARCLLTGEEFLGRFPVVPLTGRLGFLNYEVSAAQLARWADDAGVDRRRLYLANLRGRRNPLGHKQDRAELARRMKAHDVEAVIVDPFGRAYTGTNQNDAGEVGAWLTDLDSFVRTEVGARDLFLTVHAGWNGERTRGSSAIEDWGDALVFLTKDDMDRRYLKAEGRDVELDEDALDYDAASRRLTLSGAGNRKAAAKRVKADKLMPVVERIVTETPGLNWSALLKAVRAAPDAGEFQDGDVTLAVQLLDGTGRIRREVGGPGKPTLHYPWEPFDPAAGASDDAAPATSAKGSDG